MPTLYYKREFGARIDIKPEGYNVKVGYGSNDYPAFFKYELLNSGNKDADDPTTGFEPSFDCVSITITEMSFTPPSNEEYENSFTMFEPDNPRYPSQKLYQWTYTDVPEGYVIPKIAKPNTAPLAKPDFASTSGETINVDVLSNDIDPDGDPLSVNVLSSSAGTASVTASGLITYTPKTRFTFDDLDESGTIKDIIKYTVSDGKGHSTQSTLTISIELPELTASPAVTRKVEGDHGNSNMVFKLYLSQPAANDVEFKYQTESLKAQSEFDFVSQSGSYVINAGEDFAEIFVPIIGDLNPEGMEDFNLVISNVVNAKLPGHAASQLFRGVIVDDDLDDEIPIDDITDVAPEVNASDKEEIEDIRQNAIELLEISTKIDKPVQKLIEALGKQNSNATVAATALKNIKAIELVSNLVKISKAYDIVEAAWNEQAPDGDDAAAWGEASQKLAVLVGSSIAGRVGGALIVGSLTPVLGTLGAIAVGAIASAAIAGTVKEAVTTLVKTASNRFPSDSDETTAWQGPEDSTGSSLSPFNIAVGDTAPEPSWEYDPVTKKVTWLKPLTEDIRFHLDATASRMGLPTKTAVPFSYTGSGVTAGGTGDDILISDGGSVAFLGRAGADQLQGGSSADRLDGGTGADTMTGLSGNDTYFVDNARDVVVEAVGGGRDTVITTVSYKLAAGQQIEILQTADANGKVALNLTGNAFGNKLVGNAGANMLDGGAGIDEMRGGAGNDTYRVDNARDIVVEAVGGGRDTVITTVSYKLGAGQQIETLQTADARGTAALKLTGNEFGNKLVGNAGANVLDGGAGADEIRGEAGNDMLTGGKGADTFVFATKLGAGNIDRIADFAVEDTLRLSKSIFTALAPGELKANEFKDIAKAKVDADDHILYDSRSGDLFYDADGSGKAAAVKFVVLDNKAVITHADFLIT